MKLFNTATRKKEDFNKTEAKIYTCGPTVYNFAHIGNLRTYVFEDILVRTLELNDIKVTRVMNITDVGHLTSDADEGEDKMEKGAKRENKTVWQIADEYTIAFKKDMQDLNIEEPNIWCKATDHIKEQLELIKKLKEKGFTYKIQDGIYFDTSKFPDYGKLANLDLKNLKEGARVKKTDGKKNPTDFALWKFSPKDTKRQMEWDSEFGKGFPGWHLECSAMALKYLGEHIDIHCGGIDHLPVHHTNEIAQSEASGIKAPWVDFWMHGEHLNLGKERMAKSGKSFITLKSLKEQNVNPLAYRYFLLQTHYRKQLQFNLEALNAAQISLNKIYEKIIKFRKSKSTVTKSSYKEKIKDALNDDLNTAKAIAILHEAVDSSLNDATKLDILYYANKVLKLDFEEYEPQTVDIPKEVQALLEKRKEARENKDFALSDQLREEINKLGFEVKDAKNNQIITRSS